WPTRCVDHPTKWTARIQHRRAVGAFPAAIAACTLAAFGGQRGALTTLRNGPSAPTRRALGAFPGRHRGCTDAALGGQRDALTTLRECPARSAPLPVPRRSACATHPAGGCAGRFPIPSERCACRSARF